MSAASVQRARHKAKRVHDEMEKALDNLAASPAYAAPTVTTAAYRKMLLDKDGWMMARGEMYDIVGKSLGAGVYRVTLKARDPQ